MSKKAVKAHDRSIQEGWTELLFKSPMTRKSWAWIPFTLSFYQLHPHVFRGLPTNNLKMTLSMFWFVLFLDFSHYLGMKAISPMHWIKFLIGTHMIECPKDKIIIHRASGEGYGVPSGLQRSKKSSKITKIGYFSHIMAIRAISPIHWIKFLFGTHMIECPKDKIVIHRVSGEGYWVPPGLQRAQKSSKIAQNWLFFTYFGH